MRVIAGSARGLRLQAPPGLNTRPTTDRVKEALFSIIESTHHLTGSAVLDLYAGSGALAIEALSRGAGQATLIEKSRPTLAILRKNLQHARCHERATIICQDVLSALEQLARKAQRFDLILCDPPYAAGLYERTIKAAAVVLQPDGMVIAETSARDQLAPHLGGCVQYDRRVYGDTALVFYRLEACDAP